MIIHPQFPAALARFQDHLVLETDTLFRIILYWIILRTGRVLLCVYHGHLVALHGFIKEDPRNAR